MEKLLMKIKIDWEILSSEPEFEIIILYAEQARTIIKRYSIYIAMSTIMFLLPPLIPYVLDTIVPRNETREWRFIYEADYGLDDEAKYYIWIMLHDYIAAYVKIATSLATDTLFMIFAQHACSIFAALGFVSELESAYAFSYLIQICVIVIIISLLGSEVLLNLERPQEAIRFLLFFAGHIFSLYFISLPSQRLMDHSSVLRNHAYCNFS